MKILRKILGCISLTAAMFVFQACYGTAQEDFDGNEVSFKVMSAEDGSPIEGVRIRSQFQSNSDEMNYDWEYIGITDETGVASGMLRTSELDVMYKFTDADSLYEVKDTVINDAHEHQVEVYLRRR
ncbi:MAG: hypothetical protein IJL38_01580 [Bacteroidales bacterium]|nr:hypothetical protein [Bacteroidales bacterium]